MTQDRAQYGSQEPAPRKRRPKRRPTGVCCECGHEIRHGEDFDCWPSGELTCIYCTDAIGALR